MEKKSKANISLSYALILAGQYRFLGLCPGHFGKNPARNLRQTPSAGLLFWFFQRSLVFEDENH